MAENERKKTGKKITKKTDTSSRRALSVSSSKKSSGKRKRPVGGKSTIASRKNLPGKTSLRSKLRLSLGADEPEVARLVVGLPAAASEADPLDNLGELAESYGTRRIFALARDPEWVFVYWDWSWEQLDQLRHSTPEHKVFVRLLSDNGEVLQQALIDGGVRDWFFHQRSPGMRVFAELGVYVNGSFQTAARSAQSEIPRMSAAPGAIRYVTVPVSISFEELARLIEFHRLPGERLLETVARLQDEGFVFPFEVPRRVSTPESKWAKLVEEWEEEFRRVIRVGSEDVVKTWRVRHGRFQHELEGARGQAPSSIPPTSWPTSWGGSESAFKPRGFFMHVNAELIIYGGTDPAAKVRVDGEEITISKDGTFYYHFVFPDGAFHIPISATSPDGVETREALLSFLRLTEKSGGVDNTGQPGHLTEPLGRQVVD